MAIKMVYFHIPFCISKCIYCDFYSEIDLSLKKKFIKALKKEINLRYKNEKISSIYFGGGTPSLLDSSTFSELISIFNKTEKCEITIECNPEDVNKNKINGYLKAGVNRISLGVQSLNDSELITLKRRHNKIKAIEALKIIKENTENFNCDLIIGIKNQNESILKNTLQELLSFSPPHISIYPLEMKRNLSLMESRERKADLLKFAWDFLNDNGYIHYEISNFAKKGFICNHNMGYWLRKDYFGFGPSAHSLIKNVRIKNVSSIEKYINCLEKSKLPFLKEEILKNKEIKWEKFILNMRTNTGFPLKYFKKKDLKIYEESDFIRRNKNKLCLTEKGMLLYNSLILKLENLLIYPL